MVFNNCHNMYFEILQEQNHLCLQAKQYYIHECILQKLIILAIKLIFQFFLVHNWNVEWSGFIFFKKLPKSVLHNVLRKPPKCWMGSNGHCCPSHFRKRPCPVLFAYVIKFLPRACLLRQGFHSTEGAVVLTEMETRYIFKIKGPGGLESESGLKCSCPPKKFRV